MDLVDRPNPDSNLGVGEQHEGEQEGLSLEVEASERGRDGRIFFHSIRQRHAGRHRLREQIVSYALSAVLADDSVISCPLLTVCADRSATGVKVENEAPAQGAADPFIVRFNFPFLWRRGISAAARMATTFPDYTNLQDPKWRCRNVPSAAGFWPFSSVWIYGAFNPVLTAPIVGDTRARRERMGFPISASGTTRKRALNFTARDIIQCSVHVRVEGVHK